MTNHGASQAPPPAVSVTESRKSFGGTTVLDGIDRPPPRAACITMVMMPVSSAAALERAWRRIAGMGPVVIFVPGSCGQQVMALLGRSVFGTLAGRAAAMF